MTVRPIQIHDLRPCVQAEHERARLDVLNAVIPAFAERFPDQFEHAVHTVAAYRLRDRGCNVGDLAAA